ncbi:phosphatidylinositol-glycan biosynthesis class W protein [Synchiropus splendidus]|uniref:phosphatidylinositol-glycan biosynthesis class W protein n=1 Tax=Synchiropus splendidus TaxID=270530 RepID=UPI00237E0C58|nr:phosphatidylinositol-glycan biosynthesis class W protein [Synchiropus splendidus]XP_053703592.1 phosphatidylinositol-glycan biosynthesis class W protein [Synchiropus splendidus]
MSQKSLKEAFVSNLNGTTTEEVAIGSLTAPLCFLCRGLVFILLQQAKISPSLPLSPMSHLLLDFAVLILPLVVSCTILSDFLHRVVLTSSMLLACLIFSIYWVNIPAPNHKNTMRTFLLSHVQFSYVPFVTVFRVFVNIKTAISILAVDFAVFPRRFAKTETYGTGVMDFGVGAYIFANALVSPEARSKSTSGSRTAKLFKQLIAVWPLIALGMGRLVSVKMTGYHEHVTEYGVHWNFFFTLAVVRIVASALLVILPHRMLIFFSLLIAGLYQFTLETTKLKEFMIHNNDRDKDFLYANKEGIFSVVGNVAIYIAGVEIGLYVMQPRSQVKEWLKLIVRLLVGSFVLYGALFACQSLLEPVSRRLANLPFCLWSVAQSLLLLSCFGIADVCLLFAKYTSGCHFVPSSWTFSKKDSEAASHKEQFKGVCLVQAVSKNQLVFFLLANVMTGLTNAVVDTFSCTTLFSLGVLTLYMFVNSIVIHVLDTCGIVLKFW